MIKCRITIRILFCPFSIINNNSVLNHVNSCDLLAALSAKGLVVPPDDLRCSDVTMGAFPYTCDPLV